VDEEPRRVPNYSFVHRRTQPSLISGNLTPLIIPLHLLHTGTMPSSGARLYSSQSDGGKIPPFVPLLHTSQIASGDPIQDDHRQVAYSSTPKFALNDDSSEYNEKRRLASLSSEEVPAASQPSMVSRTASSLGYPVLNSLFEQPTVGRYSRVRSKPRQPDNENSTPQDVENDAIVRYEAIRPRTKKTSSTGPQKVTDTSTSLMDIPSSEKKRGPSPRAAVVRYTSSAEQPSNEKTPTEILEKMPAPGLRSTTQVLDRHSASNNDPVSAKDSSSLHRAATTSRPWGLPIENEVPARKVNIPNVQESGESASDTATSSPARPTPSLEKSSPSLNDKSAPTADSTTGLTHLNQAGEAQMVDVGQKAWTHRTATAWGCVLFGNDQTAKLILENNNRKGDVLGTARLAGIMGAKRCSDLIPLCHPIAISNVSVDLEVLTARQTRGNLIRHNEHGCVHITATVECHGPTGVEMEALTAVTTACLTVMDMCKAVDKLMRIQNTRVVLKDGGRSGRFVDATWEHEMERQKKLLQKFVMPVTSQA